MIVRPVSVFLGLIATLLVIACSGRRHAVLDHDLRQDAGRSLWHESAAPLATGTRALGEVLPRIDQASAVFILAGDGAKRRDESAQASDLCLADRAVFFHLEEQDGQRRWWRFDPRGAILVPVAAQDSFVRLLPTANGGQLHRYDVTITDDRIAITSHARLSDDAIQEAVIAGDDVVCVRRDGTRDDPRACLVAIPLAGGPARILLTADEPAAAPFALGDGSVLIALGPPGARTAWRLDPRTGERHPWTEALPARPGADLILGVDDDLAPSVLRLPTQLDLATLLALTEARDPGINRRRALLAAALAESGQLHMTPMPSLHLGFDYTPVDGLLVDPVGAVGDVLAVGLMRGVVGLVQPLFDIPRRRAAAAAGTIRVAIAADLLHEEIQEHVAEAAEDWCFFQYYTERLALDQALVDNADRTITRIQHQRSAGGAAQAELLRAHHQRTAAAAALDDSERRRDTFRDRLRRRCGIATGSAFDIIAVTVPVTALEVPPQAVVERTALLNRPHLIAARRVAEETFYIGEANAPGWSGGPGVTYGQVRSDDDGSAVTDYLSLRLDASIPLRTRGAGRLNAERAAALVAAQRAAADDAAITVRHQASTAWADAHAALAASTASTGERHWRQEQLRVARLWATHGSPDATRFQPASGTDAAEYDYMRAAINASERARDAALALVRLGRVMGTDRLHLSTMLIPVPTPATAPEFSSPPVTEPPSAGLEAPPSIDPEGETRP